jgi:hypothetical protein
MQRAVGELNEALRVYTGDSLLGLSIEGSAAFEEWAFFRREALRSQLVKALPEAGDRAAAERQYAACARLLKAELGVEPDEQTRAQVAAPRVEEPLSGARTRYAERRPAYRLSGCRQRAAGHRPGGGLSIACRANLGRAALPSRPYGALASRPRHPVRSARRRRVRSRGRTADSGGYRRGPDDRHRCCQLQSRATDRGVGGWSGLHPFISIYPARLTGFVLYGSRGVATVDRLTVSSLRFARSLVP